MFHLFYSAHFRRKMRKLVRRKPSLQKLIDGALAKLEQDPFDSSLSSHKAPNYRGQQVFSSSVTKDLRITWDYRRKYPNILDIFDVGGHTGGNKVYK